VGYHRLARDAKGGVTFIQEVAMRESRAGRARRRGVSGAALLLAATLVVPAQKAGAVIGHYNPGIANLRDFFQPPPGAYYTQYNYVYLADIFRDRNGNVVDTARVRGRTVAIDTNVNLYAISPMFVWAPDWTILGARYAAYVALSFANPSLQAAIDVVEAGRRFEFDSGSWGLGDTFVQPIWLQWTFPRVDLTAGYGFYAPTGRFELGATDNVGLGFWTHQLQSAVAFHLDEAKTLSLVGVQTWQIPSRFQDQDLTPGARFDLNWGISKIWLGGMLETAALAYDTWQITHDHGSDVAPLFGGVKDQVHAAGVQLGIPKWGLQVKYLREFGAVQRFQGSVVTFTFALPLAPLFEQLTGLAG
jgi:hypothetical protein